MNEAIGWALFHFLWEGAAIALILAIVLVICRSAQARYAAACAALLAMLAAFGVTLAVKVPNADWKSAPTVHIPAGVLPPPPVQTATPAIDPANAMPYRWAVPIWLVGVALFSLHRLAGFAGTYRLRRTGTRVAPAAWQTRMRELAARVGVTRTVQLVESCLTEVPLTAGYLRPAILLPMGMLAGLPAEQMEYILIHELAHIARRDYLVNVLQSLVEALLFYHPAVWWVSGVIRTEREHCCDDTVVALAGDARGYAAALVTLEQARSMEPAMAANGGSLTHRVRRLLAAPAPQSVGVPLAAAALALGIVGIAIAGSDPQQIPLPSVTLPHPAGPVLIAQAPVQPPVMKKDSSLEPPTAAGELPSPYRKWLNEDVAYIITDRERAAYRNLQTDEEREQFITQFWLVRDPTPGTIENEFKEEHYRRIGYANEHFSTQIPGWKTDRGRVYITYGPPDEIDDHSSGGAYQRPAAEGGGTTTTFPFQQWRYRLIEGIGTNVIIEFVDPTMSGEFRMTRDPSEKDALLYVPGAALTQREQLGLSDQARSNRIEQFAKLQTARPAPAVAPTTGNVYVSNEPGGRASVQVLPASSALSTPGRGGRGSGSNSSNANERAVNVSLPLPSAAKYRVEGKVSQTDGHAVAGFIDVADSSQFNASLRLQPGSFVLTLTYTNTSTGEAQKETVNFFVY
jgi:GWxTD domain-containing protein